MTESKLKIVIHPMPAWGHINSCLGLAETFQERGHSVSFMIDSSMKGHFPKLGYGECLLYRKNAKESKETFVETAGLYKRMFGLSIADYHRKYGVEAFRDADINLAIMLENEPQIEAHLKAEKFDLFIYDTYYVPGSVIKSGISYIHNFSSNPLMIYNGLDASQQQVRLPPFGSGFCTDGSDRDLWQADFDVLGNRAFKHFSDNQKALYEFAELTADQIPDDSKIPTIYGFPKELDYCSIIPTPENWFQIDAYCRKVEKKPLNLPEGFYNPEVDKLVYFSLGTICSLDVPLLKRIMEIFAKLPYKFIVSKGPKSDEFSLPENCWGDSMIPQISAIEKCDLVITHSGNNTITESLTLGKPMIGLPMFFDQSDNAQRIQEQGYGIRLNTYKFQEQEMVKAIDFLLNDLDTRERCKRIKDRISTSDRKDKMCLWIEQLCRNCKS